MVKMLPYIFKNMKLFRLGISSFKRVNTIYTKRGLAMVNFNKEYHSNSLDLLKKRDLIMNTMGVKSYTFQARNYSKLNKPGDEDFNKIDKEHSKENTPPVGIGAKLRYFLLKQNRPFNIDEVTAFLSWILMGNVLWILIGTTTFFGFLIYIVNWIGDREIEKRILKKLITFDNKLVVDFNDPRFKASWEDGKIKIRNLKVYSNLNSKVDNNHSNKNDNSITKNAFSEYKLTISEIDLTFSFSKWLDGKGLIEGIEIYGLNGDIMMLDGEELLLDNSFSDNYELNHLKVKHSQITFHNDKYFNQPLELDIFNCDLDRLRRKWMVYDFLNANSMFGSLGGSLFTLHKRQHRFAHFNGMDFNDESDDFNNSNLNKINKLSKGIENNDLMIDNGNELDNYRDNKGNKNMNMNENTPAMEMNSNSKLMNDDNRLDDDDNYGNGGGDDIWKKMTRIRIDMLDLSFLNNENSKLNWIESGKAEVIFDIMLPNDDYNRTDFSGKVNGLSKEFDFQFSIDGFKRTFDTIYKKLTDNYDYEEIDKKFEQNKYVVIDMKINYFDLSARFPHEVPKSSLTGLPYISSQDLQSLVTFINDEKFGLSSNRFIQTPEIDSRENPFDGSEIENGENSSTNTNTNNNDGNINRVDNNYHEKDHEELHDEDNDGYFTNGNNDNKRSLPAIKFRIIQNLNDFEYLDLPSLLSFTSMAKPDANCDEKLMKSFVNTNKFIDSSIVEVLALLLVYKEEIQTHLIDMYSRRSGFEILFNNILLGNLILVGLGSFVI